MNYSQKILELQRQFDNTKYNSLLESYYKAYSEWNIEKMDEILKQFPTEIQLLETLVEKLRGKSVFSNLKKIIRGESVDKVNKEIGLSSLYTHICIECKQNPEYKILKIDVLEKINKLAKEN